MDHELFPLHVTDLQITLHYHAGRYSVRSLAKLDGRGWNPRLTESYDDLSIEEAEDVISAIVATQLRRF